MNFLRNFTLIFLVFGFPNLLLGLVSFKRNNSFGTFNFLFNHSVFLERLLAASDGGRHGGCSCSRVSGPASCGLANLLSFLSTCSGF